MSRTLLVRFECLTPTHLGAAGGEAMLDRPTQKDVQTGLPFLPGSALKGVLAGALGDVPEPEPGSTAPVVPNSKREPLYGSPDRGTQRGVPSAIVVGNADLLACPLPATGGGVSWLFPAAAAARILRFAPAKPPELAAALDLLARLEQEAQADVAYFDPGTVRLPERLGVCPLAPGAAAGGPGLARWLRSLAGLPPVVRSPVVVAGGALVGRLWSWAAERRTLTALEARRVVRDGSLRTVELIPAGSIFVAPVTLLGEHRPAMAPIQAGAWESLGLGWLRLAEIEAGGPGEAAEPAAGSGHPPGASPAGADPAAEPAPRLRTFARMKAAFEAVRRLAAAGDDAVVTAARAAVYNFGPRARLYGLDAAVAFSLAKAKPNSVRPTVEGRAHRWLLGALLGRADVWHASAATCPPLGDWLAGRPFDGDVLEAATEAIFDRWLWLRRYAEIELVPATPPPPPPPTAPPAEAQP